MQLINQDILKVKNGSICQQVNCQNVMGSGLAKAIYTKWPVVKSEYHKYCQGKNPLALLSTCHAVWVDIPNGIVVMNLFGQLEYGRENRVYTNYEALEIALTTAAFTSKLHLESTPLYIPYGLGCGLAHGDWGTVYSILQRVENMSNIEIVICRK